MADPLADEVTELRRALDADAADLWRVINAIRDELKARWWITESRGSYAYDDERYRQETRHAFEAITAILDAVQAPASTRFLDVMRRTDRAEVAAVRGAERRWQSIETAPQDGTWIIARQQGGELCRVSWGMNRADEFAWCGTTRCYYNLTHWTPMPADPPSLTPPSDQEK